MLVCFDCQMLYTLSSSYTRLCFLDFAFWFSIFVDIEVDVIERSVIFTIYLIYGALYFFEFICAVVACYG